MYHFRFAPTDKFSDSDAWFLYDMLNNNSFTRNQMTAKTFILELLAAESNVYGVHTLLKQSDRPDLQDHASLEMF